MLFWKIFKKIKFFIKIQFKLYACTTSRYNRALETDFFAKLLNIHTQPASKFYGTK